MLRVINMLQKTQKKSHKYDESRTVKKNVIRIF